jgi:hypothetical protein
MSSRVIGTSGPLCCGLISLSANIVLLSDLDVPNVSNAFWSEICFARSEIIHFHVSNL